MKHEAMYIRRHGQFVRFEHNWRCKCGEQGKWKDSRLLAEGLFDTHLMEEEAKASGKNPDVQRVQELRRSSAASPVHRDKPRSTEKRALKLEWFE